MKYTQKEYEEALREPKERMDFSNSDLSGLSSFPSDVILDNPHIQEISFKNAKLPSSFIKKIVSTRGSYAEVFGDDFGSDVEVDLRGVDFSSTQIHTPFAKDNFHCSFTTIHINKAKFKWDNGKVDSVEHRASRSNVEREDLEDKVNALLEESKANRGDDAQIEKIAIQIRDLFEKHPFVKEKYYFTYDLDSEEIKDLYPAFEEYRTRTTRLLESDYSLGRKLRKFFSFGRKASQVRTATQMLNELKSEIRDLKRDLD